LRWKEDEMLNDKFTALGIGMVELKLGERASLYGRTLFSQKHNLNRTKKGKWNWRRLLWLAVAGGGGGHM
jgi:hypothetical protein